MTTSTETGSTTPTDSYWYLRLLADALVIVTFCGLAISLATSFAVAS